ncbi:MAG: response regulator transcription factor [Myxococcota bacterium]
MRPRKAIEVVERCYRIDCEPEEWLARVTDEAGPLVDAGLGAYGLALRRIGRGRLEPLAEVYRAPSEVPTFIHDSVLGGSPEVLEYMVRRAPVVDVGRESARKLGLEEVPYAHERIEGRRLADHVSVIGRDGSDEVVAINALSHAPIEMPPRKRNLLRRLTWHMTAGWRLMRTATAFREEAVLDPEGRCLHAEGPARSRTARDALRTAVRAVDRARGSLRRRDPEEALALWRGLVRGRWSLVDRFESDGRRYVIAHRNDPRYADPRRLSRREQQCARLAAGGFRNAEIGYALGLRDNTAGSHVHAALRKLGLAARHELAEVLEPAPLADARATSLDGDDGRLWAISTPAAPPVPGDSGLTAAEREVARALLQGASLADIARTRGTSPRTVANQVQSIYRKLHVRSRTELGATLRGRAASPPRRGAWTVSGTEVEGPGTSGSAPG